MICDGKTVCHVPRASEHTVYAPKDPYVRSTEKHSEPAQYVFFLTSVNNDLKKPHIIKLCTVTYSCACGTLKEELLRGRLNIGTKDKIQLRKLQLTLQEA